MAQCASLICALRAGGRPRQPPRTRGRAVGRNRFIAPTWKPLPNGAMRFAYLRPTGWWTAVAAPEDTRQSCRAQSLYCADLEAIAKRRNALRLFAPYGLVDGRGSPRGHAAEL